MTVGVLGVLPCGDRGRPNLVPCVVECSFVCMWRVLSRISLYDCRRAARQYESQQDMHFVASMYATRAPLW